MTLCQATTSSGVNEQPEDKAAPKGPPSSFVQHDEKVFKRRTTSASVLATRKDSLSSRAITTRSSVTWERLVRLTNFGLRPIRATRFLWTCRAPFTQSSDNYDKALAIERDAFRRDPGYAYHNLVASYLSLNRLEEAQATAEEARARNSNSPDIRFSLYSIAFLRNDLPGMARQVAWGAGKPGLEDVLLDLEADAAAYSGGWGTPGCFHGGRWLRLSGRRKRKRPKPGSGPKRRFAFRRAGMCST